MRTSLKSSKGFLFFLPFGLVALGFIFVPLAGIFMNALAKNGTFVGLQNFQEVLTDGYVIKGIKNSAVLALLSTVAGIVLSFLSAYLIHSSKGRFREYFINLLNITSNFQGVQLAFAFMILLGNSGVLVLLGKRMGWDFLGNYDLYTAFGLLAVFTYFQIPLGTLLLYPSFDAVEDMYVEAAEILGATGFTFWRRVGIPILAPSLWGTASILFANAMAAYATPYAILGANYPLLAIQISGKFTGDIIQQPDTGSAMCVLLLAFTVAGSVIARFMTPDRKGEK